MAASIGLILIGLIARTALGTIVVAALVLFLWKMGKLADAYAQKLKTS